MKTSFNRNRRRARAYNQSCGSASWAFVAVLVLVLMAVPQYMIMFDETFTLVPRPFTPAVTVEEVEALREAFYIPDAEVFEAHMTRGRASTRVAMLSLYLSDALPPWFDTFAYTARTSADLFDWIIVVPDHIPLRPVPANVKMIRISPSILYQRIASLDSENIGPRAAPDGYRKVQPREGVISAIHDLLSKYPYATAELKPALGFMFGDVLRDYRYTHWGYADMDQLVGRLDKVFDSETLNAHDVITSSFGDNYRLYMRGQLTIHKNSHRVNNLWRQCRHLREYNARLREFVARGGMAWHFHSAEGVYSKVVVGAPEVSLLVTSNQISDAMSGSAQHKESLLASTALLQCYEAPVMGDLPGVKEGILDPEAARTLGSYLSANTSPLHSSALQGEEPPDDRVYLRTLQYNCAYWLPPGDMVCLSDVPADVDIIGNRDKERYYVAKGGDPHAWGKCREGVISHFQSWKRGYYTSTVPQPTRHSSFLLISEVGFIPLRFPIPRYSPRSHMRGRVETQPFDVSPQKYYRNADLELAGVPTFESFTDNDIDTGTILSRLSPSDVRLEGLTEEGYVLRWVSAKNSPHLAPPPTRPPRGVRPDMEESSERKGAIDADSHVATAYCGRFSIDLHRCQCPISAGGIQVWHTDSTSSHPFSGGTTRAPGDEKGITLITAMWLSDLQSTRLLTALSKWEGPKILVVAVRGKGKEGEPNDLSQLPAVRSLSDLTIISVNVGPCMRRLTTPVTDRNAPGLLNRAARGGVDSLPDNMLYNVGLDAAQTDYVLVVPRGMELLPGGSIGSSGGSNGDEGVDPSTLHKQAMKGDLALPNFVLAEQIKALNGESDNALPVALVVPAFFQATKIGFRPKVSPPSPFPSKREEYGDCVADHSEALRIPFRSWASEARAPSVEYGAVSAPARHSLMLPVVFNTKDSPHGDNFVRFPEELSGAGCHGQQILRSLSGSGYRLKWADVYALSHASSKGSLPGGSGVTSPSPEPCQCVHSFLGENSGEERALGNFMAALDSYFDRAHALREEGVQRVYSPMPFAERFEKEQASLLEAKRQNGHEMR